MSVKSTVWCASGQYATFRHHGGNDDREIVKRRLGREKGGGEERWVGLCLFDLEHRSIAPTVPIQYPIR